MVPRSVHVLVYQDHKWDAQGAGTGVGEKGEEKRGERITALCITQHLLAVLSIFWEPHFDNAALPANVASVVVRVGFCRHSRLQKSAPKVLYIAPPHQA